MEVYRPRFNYPGVEGYNPALYPLPPQVVDLGLITDSESLFAIAAEVGVAGDLGLVTDSESLFSIDALLHPEVTLGLITDNESVFSITGESGLAADLSLVQDSETLFAISALLSPEVTLGLAQDSETLFPISPTFAGQVDLGLVSDSELLFTILPDTAFGLVTDNETLFAITPENVVAPNVGTVYDNETLFRLNTSGGGVLAENVPNTGDDGPAFAYDELVFPDDTGKLVTYTITQSPSAGTFITNSDTSFTFAGPVGNYCFKFDLFLDGELRGNFTRTIRIEKDCRPKIKTVSDTTYTILEEDDDYLILFTAATEVTVTYPAGISIRHMCHLHQDGAGQVVLVAGEGATLKTAIGLKTRAQYSSMSVITQEEDTAKIIGDVEA